MRNAKFETRNSKHGSRWTSRGKGESEVLAVLASGIVR